MPLIIARKGAAIPTERDFGLLHELRQFLQWRCRDAVLLAEANVPPDESLEHFGEEGDRLQLMLNFPVNQRLFYALATEDIGPLTWALQQTAKKPRTAQWVHLLRSHHELDRGRLSREQRAAVMAAQRGPVCPLVPLSEVRPSARRTAFPPAAQEVLDLSHQLFRVEFFTG